jgi:GT2 family glycosyltransferase
MTGTTPRVGEKGEVQPRDEKVYAIVLNWNGLDDTFRCVDGLLALEPPLPHVLVVDNGSRDSPREAVLARFPSVEVIENGENLGYAGGNNAGLRRAVSAGADYAWVLNNDAVPAPSALKRMLETAGAHPRAAAVGSKVVYADRPEIIWATWGEITWLQSLVRLPGQGMRDDGRFDAARTVDWLPGCSILFRTAALAEIGLFDESFFAYHEDADWGARAHESGWECWYDGRAVVRHAVHGSSGGAAHYGGFRKYLSARNSILYARRHGTSAQRAKMAAAILATLPFQYLRRLATGEQAGVSIKVQGWLDGLRNRPLPLEELGLRRGQSEQNPWQRRRPPG